MSDDVVTTRIDAVSFGAELDLHFQEYWVQRRAADDVKGVRFHGADAARPAPGVLEAIASADAVVIAPSNPVVSISPILAVPGIREAIAARRDRVVGVSGHPRRRAPGRDGRPADARRRARGERGRSGRRRTRDSCSAWVIDERDRELAPRIEREQGVRVAITDSVMHDDEAAEALARTALAQVAG